MSLIFVAVVGYLSYNVGKTPGDNFKQKMETYFKGFIT